jgi:hypothetical protein
MARPDPVQTGVIVEAVAVIGEPARQCAVMKYRPHFDPAFTGSPQHLGDQIDSLTIPTALPRFEAGPVEGPTERPEPEFGRLGEIRPEVDPESAALS